MVKIEDFKDFTIVRQIAAERKEGRVIQLFVIIDLIPREKIRYIVIDKKKNGSQSSVGGLHAAITLYNAL